MKVYAKLLLLLTGLVVLFCILALFINFRAEREVLEVKAGYVEHEGEVFDRILELERANLATFAYDYSWWQDLIDWIEHDAPDLSFIHDQFEAAPATYGVEAFAIYGPDGKRLTPVLGSDMDVLDEPGIPEQLSDEILRRPSAQWFTASFEKCERSWFEYFIVPIQPQEDADRTGKHYGYLAAIRHWDDAYLRKLEALSGSTIELYESSYVPEAPPAGWTGEVHFSRSFKDYSGTVQVVLDIAKELTVADRVITKLVEAFWIVLLATACAIAVVVAFVLFVVSKPLKVLSDAMAQGKASTLDRNQFKQQEFARLAKLITEREAQQDALKEEIALRKETESALKRSRDLAESADRTKSRFLTNMSHETRTPLHSISGYASLLEDTDLDEVQRESVEEIRQSSDRLEQLLSDIIELSSLEKHELYATKAQIDLHAFEDELIAAAESLCADKQIDFSAQLCENCPKSVFTDYAYLRRVLLHLIENAVKFTREGSVVFRTQFYPQESAYRLIFEIEDTGIGIHSDELERVFDPFYQSDDSDSRSHEGGGLGLAIARSVAEMLGGELTVESEPHQGSLFRLSLMFSQQQVVLDAVTPVG
ncbi:sensor histidine kinase [Coraliomargarita akajimensis]|uniref:histidine kinase n=1 Tax=Coraliomargarita akajimensis (strain DSM 45221 / IAM 15411 / JCM 23193 / KCTC 12865 / 04OKA010-24) TaxID=583355 RepID=D5EIB9_CORAD|nr:ATP-binding protein [Coraliomargarita akajimensis]ADE54185.1 integral membrane sensor signal transduction histidine kinase [Coraliomargarita akajimensis DSM 45221]